MPRRPKKEPDKLRRRKPPAKTLEARENQLVALAVDVAEQQLSERTASSQVITHFLKLGTTIASLEREKLARENELLKAKAEALNTGKNLEKLYSEALEAILSYSGRKDEGGESDDED